MFARDTQESLEFTAALLSFEVDGGRWTVAELRRITRSHGVTGRHDGTRAELDALVAVLPALRRLWTVDGDERVELLNRLLDESDAVPRMVRHDDWGWHLHLYDDEQPLWQRLVAEAAMAVSDLVRLEADHRLRLCAAEGCGRPFFDQSRNASRTFCGRRCSNRTAAAAYRRRSPSEA